MCSINGFTFDLAVFDDAYETLWREKLIGKSVERERRPHEKNYGHYRAIFIDANDQISTATAISIYKKITIPNSAVASGGVIITSVRKPESAFESRLPYSVGDRVVTLYKNEAGTVKELTAFHTTILLDSGGEIVFLNNSVLSGTVAIAKIAKTASVT